MGKLGYLSYQKLQAQENAYLQKSFRLRPMPHLPQTTKGRDSDQLSGPIYSFV